MVRDPEDLETEPEAKAQSPTKSAARSGLGLIVLWSSEDPHHIGGWLACSNTASGTPLLFGRGGAQATDEFVRARAVRQRPGENEILAPFMSRSLSRSQLKLRVLGDALEVENIGRCSLSSHGAEVRKTEVRPGDVLEVGAQLVVMCMRRPQLLPKSAAAQHEFGEADAYGYVGESVEAWRLRSEVSSIATLPGHVLLLGASGTGKELVAAALHSKSGRIGPLVARNAATLPDSLVDAELFGNLKGYPNPGMVERKGLIGAADGGTLFLDEFGELSLDAQAHLLRVLDSGEYQRLGDTAARRSDFRLLAATNRSESAMRADVLARFDFRLHLPDLSKRVEDLPFIVRHLLRTMTDTDAELRERVFGSQAWPRFSAQFVRSLAERRFGTNVRELRSLLWQALPKSPDAAFEWPVEVRVPESKRPESIEANELQRVLDENNGSIEKSWRALGLSSRYAMNRLLKKHGVTITKRRGR